MGKTTLAFAAASIVAAASLHLIAAGDSPVLQPLVGEVRVLAIAPTNNTMIAELHRQGWLEARGQLLSTRDFARLYETVGRAWTADGVPADEFAIPEIKDPAAGRAPANPFGVLGPGDLITGGRVRKAWLHRAPLSYWIFAGRAISGDTNVQQ